MKIAKLNIMQTYYVKRLEHKLGITLVAYERNEVMSKIKKNSLKELKEVLIEQYDYVANLYMVTKSESTKEQFEDKMNELERRIREVDSQLEVRV